MSRFNKGDTVRVSFEAPWYSGADAEGKTTIALGFDQEGTLIGLTDCEAIPGTITVELVEKATSVHAVGSVVVSGASKAVYVKQHDGRWLSNYGDEITEERINQLLDFSDVEKIHRGELELVA